MELLHPGARWLFRFKGYAGSIVPVVFIIYLLSFILSSAIFISDPTGDFNLNTSFILIMVILALVLIVVFSEIYARMAYSRWLYEFDHDSLKLERGIIWKKYSNIPYERVQNVDIQRGILARILGFSTVNIQTAGYSMVYSGGHSYGVGSEGHIPAISVESAEKIRDFLIKRISKKHSHQGL